LQWQEFIKFGFLI